jgi:creatinine amidohydrolase
VSTRRVALAAALSFGLAGPLMAQSPSMGFPPGHPFIEELTWTEIRDAIAGGTRTVIIPTGGTEQNGPHMAMGKHNYIVTHVARESALRLGNALVAPVISWVPEGNPATAGSTPGRISNPSPNFNATMEFAARSMKAHGFTDILLMGDNGGNQNAIRQVAEKLNAEWAGSGTVVYPLTDYYDMGQEYTRMWLQAAYGYSRETIGTHAGITDTSAMMYVFPDGIRRDAIVAQGAEGVSGNPSLANPMIGRMVVEFKILSSLAQYESLKQAEARAANGGGGGGGGGRGPAGG